jgi:hypothetical protein
MIHVFTAAGSSFAAYVLLMGIRDLTSDERPRFTKLVRPSDLCGGGHIGTDPTPHDGVLEMLRADCGDVVDGRNRRGVSERHIKPPKSQFIRKE